MGPADTHGRAGGGAAVRIFAHKIAQILCVRSLADDDGRSRNYLVTGQVFFASAERFADAFDFKEVLQSVRIDVSRRGAVIRGSHSLSAHRRILLQRSG